MSLKPRQFPGLPEDTARVARAAFRKGSIYLTIGDEIGHIFRDADFEDYCVVWRDNAAIHFVRGDTPASGVRIFLWVKNADEVYDEFDALVHEQ